MTATRSSAGFPEPSGNQRYSELAQAGGSSAP